MSRFVCDDPTRRALLTGLAVGAPLAVLMASKQGGFGPRSAAGVLEVGDLVDSAGAPTPLARAREGERIVARGFRAPSLRQGALFDLYQGSTGPCLACGLVHDPGAALSVVGGSPPAASNPLARLEVAGRLTIGPRGVAISA